MRPADEGEASWTSSVVSQTVRTKLRSVDHQRRTRWDMLRVWECCLWWPARRLRMGMPVVSESRTGRSLSLKVPVRFAITTEHLAFWDATAAGHASKPATIDI